MAHFIAGALRRSEAPQTDAVGLIGTLGVGLWSASLDRLQPTANTTPGLLEILSCCVAFARADVRYVVMEVSSHALDQNRLDGVPVQMAVFTNISRDHLDYHRDMADYFSAKAKLFARPELKAAIVNFDSEQSNALFEQITETATCWTYGLGDPDWWVADCQQIIMKNLIARPSGLHLTLMTPLGEAVLDSFLIGLFNASNLLAALATLLALGMPLTMALSGLSQASAPPGRMQSLPLANEAKVIIDYAHTPDALKQVLLALRDHRAGKGRILCLFGCGGARDSGKRPLMGAVAEQLADVIVLTNDNPRSETPQAIIDDILSGISTHATVTVEPDRRRAIDAVLSMAQPDDWVLIAGKGHETTQDLAGVLHPFNDGETVRNWIAGRAT